MKSRSILALCVLVLALLPACETARYYDARYLDAPVETEVRADAVTGSQVRALASVIGVARPDAASGRPKQVEIRMRFENLGKVPAQFVADKLSLVSADLMQFGPARVAQTDMSIPAGETRQFDLAFSAPEQADPDWDGLNLRFTLQFQDVPVTVGVPFRRMTRPDYYYAYAPYYPYPYYPYPYWHVGFGYRYCW
jgi:hypothetical protein